MRKTVSALLLMIMLSCSNQEKLTSPEAFYKDHSVELKGEKYLGITLGIRGENYVIWIDSFSRGFIVDQSINENSKEQINEKNATWFCSDYPHQCSNGEIQKNLLTKLYDIAYDANKFGFVDIKNLKMGCAELCLKDGFNVLVYAENVDSTFNSWLQKNDGKSIDGNWYTYKRKTSVYED
jgi:hypothetical protein